MPPAPPPLRISVIGGSGQIGKRHCQHIASNPSTQLVAIVDPSPAATDTAELYSTSLYPTINDLLSSSNIPDAAVVCTPNHTHVPLSIQLAEAGVHILCEKPVGTDIASAQSLIDSARKHNVKLLIGHHRRFNPYMIATKKILDSGAIGQITAVSGLWTSVKPASYFAEQGQWRRSKSYGGGPILLNFIHDIDLLHYLFGPVTRIHAEKSVSRRLRPPSQNACVGGDPDADAAEEGCALTLRFASGVVGTFVLSDNVASPHNFEAATGENPMIPKTGRDVYRIFGTEGTLSVPDMVLSTYGSVLGEEASWAREMSITKVEVQDEHIAPFDRRLDHFVNLCSGEEEASCSGEEGLQALAVCEAVRRALSMSGGGGTVDIEHVVYPEAIDEIV